VRDIVEDAFRKARGILERNRGVLEKGSRLLLEKETLSEKELEALFAEGIVPHEPERENARAGPAGDA
jgi:cell division protease FtsH